MGLEENPELFFNGTRLPKGKQAQQGETKE